MKPITASAPCKLIITGEHAVVYGSPALAVAIKPECTAELREAKGELGLTNCTFEITATGKKVSSQLRAVEALNALVEHFKANYGLKLNRHIELTLFIPQVKGIGSSASIAAAVSKVLFEYLKITPTYQQLFNAVQVLEEVAHGGKASGIDAAAVLQGTVKAEKKSGKMKFTKLKYLSLPSGSELIVIDTKLQKPRQGTGEIVQIAAPHLAGNGKKLAEFTKLFKEIEKQLKPSGSAQELGKLFNKNHALLAGIGVSTEGIELARAIVLENGAYGAKITGAGGEGGAVVALVSIGKKERILKALRANNFTAFPAQFTGVN